MNQQSRYRKYFHGPHIIEYYYIDFYSGSNTYMCDIYRISDIITKSRACVNANFLVNLCSVCSKEEYESISEL